MMMQLGSYQFSIQNSAYQELSHNINYRWQSQDRINATPAYHYIGPGKEEIELEGTIHPHFSGGLNQISKLKTEASQGKPLLMNDGLGNIIGKWIISDISEVKQIFTKEGIPRQIEFRIMLHKYDQ